ncbi:MAG: 5-bromo-4-chloroindolyl phosphate hydrolysis protein, partial [Blautia sp.]|nr:5-bromo-4-chloroindolyl phosphate hydrolysis protein [Blautia sp.]
MGYQDLEKLGEGIRDTIESAVSSQSYQKLNQSITQMVNDTLKQYQGNMPKAKEREQRARQRQAEMMQRMPAVYGQTSEFRSQSILKIIFGGLLTLGMASTMLATSVIHAATGAALTPEILTFLGTLAGAGLLGSGISGVGKVNRFKKYRRMIGNRTYCEFRALAGVVGKPVQFVIKDIKNMIDRGWFLEGHIDQNETCLITTDETYNQYRASEEQYLRQVEEKNAEMMRDLQKKESRS